MPENNLQSNVRRELLEVDSIDVLVHPFFTSAVMPNSLELAGLDYGEKEAQNQKFLELWKARVKHVQKNPNAIFIALSSSIDMPKRERELESEFYKYCRQLLGRRFVYIQGDIQSKARAFQKTLRNQKLNIKENSKAFVYGEIYEGCVRGALEDLVAAGLKFDERLRRTKLLPSLSRGFHLTKDEILKLRKKGGKDLLNALRNLEEIRERRPQKSVYAGLRAKQRRRP